MQLFDGVYELATRVGDRDVQMLALSGKGRAHIKAGEIDKGLALLDEATASAMCGDLRAHSAGLVYCITISSCQDVGDYRRAAEWTEVANRWCDKLDLSGFPGACRIHRAEALRLRGDWPAAEAQALEACEELHDFDHFIAASGRYEVGEIRRRRGDFAGAEEAFRISNEMGRDPQPGLSLLRLGEGKIDAAAAGIARSLLDTADPLSRLRRLPAQVEIAIASGDLRTARAAADEAEGIVDSYKIGNRRAVAFDATLHFARGQIHLAEKDWDAAARALQHARDEWQKVGAPYETARARMLLGTAYARSGDEHASAVELESALATFERLGARPEEERIKELLGRVEARRTFLFTDIVDSTRLLDTLGDDKWKRLLARHNELIREQIAEAGGEVVKQTGDGFFASFEHPKAAIEAAVGIQRALAAEIVAPDVRIGAHAGGAFRTERRVDRLRRPGRARRVSYRCGGDGRRDPRRAPRRSTASAAPSGSPSRARRISRASSSPSKSSPSTGAEARALAAQAAGERPRKRNVPRQRPTAARRWYASVARRRSSVGFVMKPISTRITGTSAQLKPVKSERSCSPRSGKPSAERSSPWTIRAARLLAA